MRAPGRIELLTGASLLVLGGLSARLYALTVVRHEELRLEAERRSRRVEISGARRGRILDRKGRALALDRPSRDVVLDLTAFDRTLDFVPPLSLALGCSRAAALARLRAARTAAQELDPDERRFVLCRLPETRADRVKRAVRRIDALRVEVDAEGHALVTDAEVLRLRARVVERLAALLELEPAELERRIQARVDEVSALEDRDERLLAWEEPLELCEDAAFAQTCRVHERAFELPGVRVVSSFRRGYPFADVAGHVTGFLGKPTACERQRDLRARRLLDAPGDPLELRTGGARELPADVRLRDEPFGRSGMELRWDQRLRGRPGARVVVRDVRNAEREALLEVPAQAGEDLRLTLDVDQQRAAEAALDRAVAAWGDALAGGAAVLFDLRQGDVLALASSPRFDPNRLRERGYFAGLRDDPRQPQRHRAVAAYPPASTWKVLASFAMTDPARPGALPTTWTTHCDGVFDPRHPRRFRCDGVHGEVDLPLALERSCNVFFFRAADQVGLDPLADWAARLRIDRPVARGLGGEQAGLVPHSSYKTERLARMQESLGAWLVRLHDTTRAEPLDLAALARAQRAALHAGAWCRRYAGDVELRPGDARNAIIGQGDVLENPLQIATLAAMVAGGGRFPHPRLCADDPAAFEEVQLDPATLRLVREGMRRVVSDGTASAPRIGLRSLDVAGKTGTAERAKDQPHVAWFMGYYPAQRPEVAFAVVVDRTKGHGGDVCGPVARALIDAWEQARK
ncbi:MAG: penicillin-binding transpeptidase domain-containing protein [Planctomycetota bacterium]